LIGLTLAGLEAPIGFVDDVKPATAAHDPAIAVTITQRLDGIPDLHRSNLL